MPEKNKIKNKNSLNNNRKNNQSNSNKSDERETQKMLCTECGSNERNYDTKTCEVECASCGLILENHAHLNSDTTTIAIQNEKPGGAGYGPATEGNLATHMGDFGTSHDGKGVRLTGAQKKTARNLRRHQGWAASKALGSSSRRDAEKLISKFFDGGSRDLCASAKSILRTIWPEKQADKNNTIPPVWQPAHPYGVPAAAAAAIKITFEERGTGCRPSRLFSLFPKSCKNPQKKIFASLKNARRRIKRGSKARLSETNAICSLVDRASETNSEIRSISREIEVRAKEIMQTGALPSDPRSWLANLAWQIGKKKGLKIKQEDCKICFDSSQNMSVYTADISAYLEGGVEALRYSRSGGIN